MMLNLKKFWVINYDSLVLNITQWIRSLQSNKACPEDSLAGSENCVAAKERELTDCIFYCKLDTTCISECNRDHITKLEKCPCYDQCYNGCPCEYESEYCDTGTG